MVHGNVWRLCEDEEKEEREERRKRREGIGGGAEGRGGRGRRRRKRRKRGIKGRRKAEAEWQQELERDRLLLRAKIQGRNTLEDG